MGDSRTTQELCLLRLGAAFHYIRASSESDSGFRRRRCHSCGGRRRISNLFPSRERFAGALESPSSQGCRSYFLYKRPLRFSLSPPAVQQVAADHDPGPALPGLAVHHSHVLWVPPQPAGDVVAKGLEKGRRTI